MTRLLSHSQAARFYDLLGARLDTQAFYEAEALRDLVAHLELETCRSVMEFGLAPAGSQQNSSPRISLPTRLTLDQIVSATMVDLTKSRLRPFGRRVEVRQSAGEPYIDAADGTFDRFICTYVFDLLPDDDIRAVLTEARRIVTPDGLIGIVSLTNGPRPVSRLVSTMWRGLHHLSPWLVGGCRPISIRTFVSNTQWRISYANIIVRFGIPSEIVVARPASYIRVPN